MAKFTDIDKLNAVKRYLNETESLQTIADSIEVSKSVFLNWIQQYRHHGEKAFEKVYATYNLEYKLDVLNYMNEHGTSIRETAAIFNIPSPSTLANWRKQLEMEGLDGLKLKKKGRSSMEKDNRKKTKATKPVEGSVEALKEEVERLRMENAYLKKLNTLVQNKEKSPNKIKRK
jgi:transposase-like protein